MTLNSNPNINLKKIFLSPYFVFFKNKYFCMGETKLLKMYMTKKNKIIGNEVNEGEPIGVRFPAVN